MNVTETPITSIIPIMPDRQFHEVMELVSERQLELQTQGITRTYVYDVDPVYASEARLYCPLIDAALTNYLEEQAQLDIKPIKPIRGQLPHYFKLVELLEEFHNNCVAIHFKDMRRRRQAFNNRKKTQTYIARLK